MKEKILVIDDDEEMCEEIGEILRDEGYQVQISYNGIEGKRLADNCDYDILLLDLKIPGYDGFQILKSVKEKDRDLKVLVLTGSPVGSKLMREKGICIENEREILKLAEGIISKPFDIQILLQKIRHLTASGG
jgi:DNA-binding response OmpR family regulator